MIKSRLKGRGNPANKKKGSPKKNPGGNPGGISAVAGRGRPTGRRPIMPVVGGRKKPGEDSRRKPPTRVRPVVGGPKKPGAGSRRKPGAGSRKKPGLGSRTFISRPKRI